MSKRKESVRIELPKGVALDVLKLGAKMHGAPALSRYILTAALSYTKGYLEDKQKQIEEAKKEGVNEDS